MRYSKKIDKALLDRANLSGIVLTKEEQIRNLIENFNNSSSTWGTLGELTYRDLLFHYEPISFRDVQYNVKPAMSTTIFLPSKGQRGKSSVIRTLNKNEDCGTSTWDGESISDGFISWLTQSSIPPLKINTDTYGEFKLVGIWDGESKFQLKWRWFNYFTDSKVWKVLDEKGEFNEVESRYIKNFSRWENRKNSDLLNLLKLALDAFKDDFEFTKNQYLTAGWLKDNGYFKLIDSILDLKPNITLERKSNGCESESYHREGKRGAGQSDVNLSMTMVKDAWYDNVIYDNSKNPRDVHKPAILSACFAKSDKNNPFFRVINDNIHGSEYNEYDRYIYHFLTSCLIQINGADIKSDYGLKRYQNWFYNGLARPFDKGTKIVQNTVAEYIEYSERNKRNVKQLESEFLKVFNIVEATLGYNRIQNSQKNVGLNNEKVIQLWNTHLQKETEIIREYLKNIGIDKPGNLGTVNKLRLQQKELLYPILLNTIDYILQNKNLSETHITDVLNRVIEITTQKWLDFVWNFEIDLYEGPKSFFKFEYNIDDWKDVCRASDLDDRNDTPTFGPLYHFKGGNIEKIYAVIDTFFIDVVKPVLDSEYIDASTTSKQRYDFLRFLKNEIKNNDLSNFKIFNTRDEILRKVEEFDVGHLEADSDGGVLRHKMWIFEFNKDNRHKFKLNQKSFDLFWKEMIANCNDTLNKRKIEFIEDSDNEAKEEDYNNAKKARENLKIVLSYFKIEYNSSYSFKSGNVVLDSYVTELQNN